MTDKENSPGLLSKVVKFVTNPTTNWADLENRPSEASSSSAPYDKEALREMIERKKRNDFVRKREFDMLRKLRRREISGMNDPAVRPSFFQSSLPSSSPAGRAKTLKKIDEIEAQMSQQWWKTREPAPSSFPSAPPDGHPSAHPQAYASTQPVNLGTRGAPLQPPPASAGQPGQTAGRLPGQPGHPGSFTPPAPRPIMPAGMAPARPMPGAPGLPPQAGMARPQPAMPPAPPAALAPRPAGGASAAPQMTPRTKPADRALTDFGSSREFAVEVEEYVHDPELEEAAIRFANDDEQGALAGLLESISERGTRANHDETWMAAFDICRATGQFERYEMLAMQYVARFQRSAPQWFSIPDEVSQIAPLAPAPVAANASAHWSAPPTINAQTLTSLNTLLGRTPQPWRLDFARVSAIDDAVVGQVTALFEKWSGEPVQLLLSGVPHFVNWLTQKTPTGDKETDPQWWRLHMAFLRLLHRLDDFEMAALNYCVTYEVSPPSWEHPRSVCTVDGDAAVGAASQTHIGEAQHESISTSLFGEADSTAAGDTHMSKVELSGQLRGDITHTLEMLDQKLGEAEVFVITCDKLIRVDFQAAGALLNWVAAHRTHGHQVRFVDVHRMVAAFFTVIGITDAAKVSLRAN